MPVEVKAPEELERLFDVAVECRVKLGERRVRGEDGARRVKVLKFKVRTPRHLYTLVFDDVDKGIEYVRSVREKCKNMRVLDAELEGRI